MKIDLRSEIGELEAVILHTPGPEVENMTPKNAERALYSDILNLSVARTEYAQLADLLNAVTTTFQIGDLLASILSQPSVKEPLILRICEAEGYPDLCDDLLALPEPELARQLIEGVVLPRDNLTRFLSKERFCLPPLHNFFFTRDAAMAILDEVLIGRMAKAVRSRESMVMEAVFNHSPQFDVATVNPIGGKNPDPEATIEGGDVLVARDDILVIGNGSRTSSQGIDFIIERLKAQHDRQRHILVQELPEADRPAAALVGHPNLLVAVTLRVREDVRFAARVTRRRVGRPRRLGVRELRRSHHRHCQQPRQSRPAAVPTPERLRPRMPAPHQESPHTHPPCVIVTHRVIYLSGATAACARTAAAGSSRVRPVCVSDWHGLRCLL